ncbi:hypothetical protein TNCV_933381 [Trichonephila clavipes]|nr:hypothetical protein TNCV_933381 [Trichonephila clavipes]
MTSDQWYNQIEAHGIHYGKRLLLHQSITRVLSPIQHDLARSTPIFRDNILRSGQRHPTFFLSPLTSSEDLRIDEYLECPSATQVAYTYKHVFSDIRNQVARCSITNHHSEWASERLCC